MDEYIIKVIIDGKKNILKTYCNNIVSAIDTMVNIDMVEDITHITRTKDCKEWSVSNTNMKELRNLREQIDETLLMEGLYNLEEQT
tara:strand:+ start:30 stop:287 length:258 start_codon:yes stop_codon:yes gene_type:complete